jgi:hypothetical protein
MRVFMDPTSHPTDRERAKARLMSGGDEVDWSKLSTPELNELTWALDALGEEPAERPTLDEKLKNAIALAQERWDRLAGECQAEGKQAPSPSYAFKNVAVAPSGNPRW